jgi:ABC-type multidrug transport system ATPase subunit
VVVFTFLAKDQTENIPGSDVGYMPQEIALFNEFTIGEILNYFGIIYHMKSGVIEKRIQHLIDLLRLPKKR